MDAWRSLIEFAKNDAPLKLKAWSRIAVLQEEEEENFLRKEVVNRYMKLKPKKAKAAQEEPIDETLNKELKQQVSEELLMQYEVPVISSFFFPSSFCRSGW
jgi:DNA recombination-dependent growth factor C